ncbi:JmjC domain, hydroxylase-domain-containing protein [Gymnopilus junonius]|uniref:[histone H3]-trimethyl-L-lysine(9) demethylase n=1 Tax=Gymnopilus junonius TaxID=109634 RepID=A0A9P5NHN7_GYMJU|nr:JmjC domain, hydroxylase-domain-containing protein [Gymnopilus junonius]
MDSPLSRGSSLTPCRSPTPSIPVQPDHFYGSENVQLPPSPDSDGKTWLDPADDPMANRGIPVFKPTLQEFQDFEGYMNRVECWGMRSGIVKVIPPKEWSDSLPPLKEQLIDVKIKTPIEQHMFGNGGLFRQENMEKRKVMSVREWVELCTKDEFRAPGIHEVGLSSRHTNTIPTKSRIQRKGKQKTETVEEDSSGPDPSVVVIKEEPTDDFHHSLGAQAVNTPPSSEGSPPASTSPNKKGNAKKKKMPVKQEPKPRPKRVTQTREAREASLAERAARDRTFLDVFEPDKEWLPPSTKASDYTPEFCRELERRYWRNCGLGKPAWYGADTLGSLFTDATAVWNVAHLPSALSRLLPASDQGLPGVNTPYLYFGMWRATFAWHVEDMDLFSINYIHFGAPKFWYAIPQGRATSLEQIMRGYFPKDTSQCPQFLRHKSFLASPSILANSSCRPNYLVQQAGEFVITYPRGYHAGFNLGLNCAESVNFALESWLDLGRVAKRCECISDSVRIDVDQLLQEREEERLEALGQGTGTQYAGKSPKRTPTKKEIVKQEMVEDGVPPTTTKSAPRKRKSDTNAKEGVSVTLKLGPRPAEQEPFPCCLCVSMSKEGLLKVRDPPTFRKDAVWMAHEYCASIVPETWVDEAEIDGVREKVVFGVDGIVKDRWNLKCFSCTKNKPKTHGAPIQCTKGKCLRAFHVSCAKDGHSQGIVFAIVQEVAKEVVLVDPVVASEEGIAGSTTDMTMSAAAADDLSGGRVLKVIKKLEVQVLCNQHNPAVAAQKRANKNNKIRDDLLALPSMARIKIRVTSGVFEVSLIRVIEETGTVEVLWDRGIKKEFKWGSVVFGSTDGPVWQKPSELAPPLLPAPVPEYPPPGVLPVMTYPSVLAATGQQPYSSPYPASTSATPSAPSGVSTNSNTPVNQPYTYPPRSGPYDYWSYASQYSGQAAYPYTYSAGYYSGQMAGGSQQFNPYTFTRAYGSAQYQPGSSMSWQHPYAAGPPPQRQAGQGSGAIEASSSSGSSGQSTTPTMTSSSSTPQIAGQASLNPSYYRDRSQSITFGARPPPASQAQEEEEESSSEGSIAGFVPDQQSSQKVTFSDLAALASLQPAQITEALRNNPHLREMVLAALEQSKQADATGAVDPTAAT